MNRIQCANMQGIQAWGRAGGLETELGPASVLLGDMQYVLGAMVHFGGGGIPMDLPSRHTYGFGPIFKCSL